MKLAPLTTAQGTQEPEPQRKSYRGRGALEGQLVVGPEFFEPLSDEECGVAPGCGVKLLLDTNAILVSAASNGGHSQGPVRS